MELVYIKRFEIADYRITVQGGRETVSITLRRANESIILESKEPDFCSWVASLQKIAGPNGKPIITAIRDSRRYFDDVTFLIDKDNRKLKEARTRLRSGSVVFDFEVNETMDRLLSGKHTKHDQDIPKLKLLYYEILAFQLMEGSNLLQARRLFEKNPHFPAYADVIWSILRRAFISGSNPIGQYNMFRRSLTFDLQFMHGQVESQLRNINDQFRMLSTRGGINGDIGVGHLLDVYRRLAELCYSFLDTLLVAIDLMNNKKPKGHLPYWDVVRRLRENRETLMLVICVDPLLRHTESHVSTRVEYQPGKVGRILLVDSRRKKARTIKVYTFEEFVDMSRQLKDALFPALYYEFSLLELTLRLLVCVSPEYKMMLLGIGQK